MDTFASSLGSRGDWREFDAEDVKAHIRECAGVPDLEAAHAAAKAASETFQEPQSEIVSNSAERVGGEIRRVSWRLKEKD